MAQQRRRSYGGGGNRTPATILLQVQLQVPPDNHQGTLALEVQQKLRFKLP